MDANPAGEAASAAAGMGAPHAPADADAKKSEQVIEPTAVYRRPIITIGWDGTPAFGKAEQDED
jgi:hypothetical protein